MRYSRHTKTIVTVLLLAPFPVHSISLSEEDRTTDWLKKMAENGKRAIDDSKVENFKKYIPSDFLDLDDLSEKTLGAIESGMPGKIGYGFLMGFSSGFCLKKVTID